MKKSWKNHEKMRRFQWNIWGKPELKCRFLARTIIEPGDSPASTVIFGG